MKKHQQTIAGHQNVTGPFATQQLLLVMWRIPARGTQFLTTQRPKPPSALASSSLSVQPVRHGNGEPSTSANATRLKSWETIATDEIDFRMPKSSASIGKSFQSSKQLLPSHSCWGTIVKVEGTCWPCGRWRSQNWQQQASASNQTDQLQ